MSLTLIPDGPGTTIELRDGQQGLPPSPRGTGALLGRFTSGPVTAAALALTPETARLIAGQADDAFEAGLAMDDLYSEDTPPVLIGRVTDGLEVKAIGFLHDRKPDRSFSAQSNVINVERPDLAVVEAQNGGRWGGRRRILVGTLAAVATDVTSTTVDLATATEIPATMLEDLLADAEIEFEGDTGGPYTIVSNTTAGVATIKGEFSQALQAATGSGAIDGQFRITLSDARELAVVIGPDSVVGSRFQLTGMRKFEAAGQWEVVSQYDNLGLSTNDSKPWIQTITDGEADRYQLSITSDYTGETVEAKLPANFCEVPVGVVGPALAFQWFRWWHASGNTGNAFLRLIAAVDTAKIEPHTYTLTFTAATAFDVTVTWPDGTVQALPSGTTTATYEPDHPQLTEFRASVGGTAMVAGDVIILRVQPLPHDLSKREAYLYPVAVSSDGNPNQRLRIVSNTYNTLSVRSDLDLEDYGVAAGTAAGVTGTVDISVATITSGKTLILTPDGYAAVTLTLTTSPSTIAATIAAFTALDATNKFVFDEDPDLPGQLRIRVRTSYGTKSSLLIGAGTANSDIGLTGSSTTYGTDAVPFRIEARWPMWGGYDGVEPSAARYLLAMDPSTHVFKRWCTVNLGLVRMATPGITDLSVKQAAKVLVESHGWIYIAEFEASLEASSTPGEAAVGAMTDDEEESDYIEHYFPSRLKYLNVARTKLVTRSCSGHIIGRRSALANRGVDGERGMHIAAANNNEQGRLSPRAKGLPDDLGRWTPPIKLLNDHGIVPILWEGPSVYMFGNRLYSAGRTEQGSRYTITERAVHYHIARDLFITTRPFIFKTLGVRRLADVQLALRSKMKLYFQDGWFSDAGGARPGFEQQVSVQVPPSLNPESELIEGRVTASVQYRPKPALEDLKIILSPTSLSSEG